MKKLILYYAIIIPVYILEIFLVLFLSAHYENIFLTNLAIRILNTIFVVILLKKIIFNYGKNFSSKFLIIAMINPLLSSALIDLFATYFFIHLWIIKGFVDVVVSAISFLALSYWMSSEDK